MRIHQYRADSTQYPTLGCLNDDDIRPLSKDLGFASGDMFRGEPLTVERWSDRKKIPALPDFLAFLSFPVLRARAVAPLRECLESCELLPLRLLGSDEALSLVYMPKTPVNEHFFDFDRSRIEFMQDIPVGFKYGVLHASSVHGTHTFRFNRGVCITDKWFEVAEEARLVGLREEPVGEIC